MPNFAVAGPGGGVHGIGGTIVNVTIDEINFDDEFGRFKPNPPGSVEADYEVVNRQECDQHVYMLGITSPNGFLGATAAFVQLAAPTKLWLVDWTACRVGLKPKIPDPRVSDPNWVFLDALPETNKITVAPDGISPLYRISGTYVYGCRRPTTDVFGNLQFPKPPWLQDGVAIRTINAQDLEQGISEAGIGNVGPFFTG